MEGLTAVVHGMKLENVERFRVQVISSRTRNQASRL